MDRPCIFEYDAVSCFVADMLAWHSQRSSNFTVGGAVRDIRGLSTSLVSQVKNGKRSLTRDRVDEFGVLLQLSHTEVQYLDEWIARQRSVGSVRVQSEKSRPYYRRESNSIMSDWLNLFVRESVRLRGFRSDPMTIHRLLGGLAGVSQIRRSLSFLLRNNFLIRESDGRVVMREDVSYTTEDVVDPRIKDFTKKSLDIAKHAVDIVGPELRHNDSYLLALNRRNVPKLKRLLASFTDQIERFERENSSDDECLYQVMINLTPIADGIQAGQAQIEAESAAKNAH